MSHLTGPRVAFSGRFLSDVSTRNNSRDNFKNPPTGDDEWNAMGGATFEPLRCSLTGAWLDTAFRRDDAALSYVVTGAADRPSGKMVDVDPDYQLASEIWGFAVRIFDPDSGKLAFCGEFEPSSFRDLFTRQLGNPNADNKQPAGARFVSTLTHVEWGEAAEHSEVLKALKATSPDLLAISLHQFGYYYPQDTANYRTGTLVGSIGARLPGELRTAHVGRRILPFFGKDKKGNPAIVLSCVDIDVGSDTIGADLGHALLIDDAAGTITDVGKWLEAGHTKALAIGFAPPDGAAPPLRDDEVTLLGEAPIMERDWYLRTGGIAEWRVDSSSMQTAASSPLFLYLRTDEGLVPLAGETREGLFMRADRFVCRLEPQAEATVSFKVSRFGAPASGITIALGACTDLGTGQQHQDALSYPDTVVTDQDGLASLKLASGTLYKRDDVDGMVFGIAYAPLLSDGTANPRASGLNQFDQIVVHQREDFKVPASPEWQRDVLPILRQYAQLYPVMSQHLFDLADEATVVTHARHMLLAMERPITDPNYMPVTRDLSDAKRKMIVSWLTAAVAQSSSQLAQRQAAGVAGAHQAVTLAQTSATELGPDAKTLAAHIASGPEKPELI